MMYTLVSTAKEWFTYKFCSSAVEPEQTENPEDEVITPHGQAVTVESFLAWREQFEAELHLKEPSTYFFSLSRQSCDQRTFAHSRGVHIDELKEAFFTTTLFLCNDVGGALFDSNCFGSMFKKRLIFDNLIAFFPSSCIIFLYIQEFQRTPLL